MINLLTSYYYSGNVEKQKEINECLQKNIDNPLINNIYLYAERSCTVPFINEKINIIGFKRPNYSDFINYINFKQGFNESYNIISNTDIYFDDTLSLLDKIEMRDTCVTLNRWDVLEDGSSKFLNTKGSQDVWIFKGKINKLLSKKSDFYLGKKCCDNVFAHRLWEIGYRTISPSYDIRSYHLHNSGFRSWNEKDKVLGIHKYIYQCRIDDVTEEKPFKSYYNDIKPHPAFLFTTYFDSGNVERQKELDFCLLENASNSLIDKIFLFSETENVPKFIYDYDIDLFKIDRKPFYKDFIKFINKNKGFSRSFNIISNSDIFFDDSLLKLENVRKFKERGCVCLSRHDVDSSKNVIKIPDPNFAKTSQDCWIFKGHIIGNLYDHCKFPIGEYGCDNRLAYELTKGGYIPLNYCMDIRANHFHVSGIRNSSKQNKIPGPYREVPIIRL